MNIGLFGKLPSHGDFLRRRVTNSFADTWDAWLQHGLAGSRETLGAGWLDVYLTSPAWRFACAAGACGAAPLVGLMVPSVDRVGRYFPLTLVAELPVETSPVLAMAAAGPFYAAAEQLVIETLETEDIDFDHFENRLADLGERLESLLVTPRLTLDPASAAVLSDGSQSWQVPIESSASLVPMLIQLCAQRLTAAYEPLMLWSTEGSSAVEPSCLVTHGLPSSAMFVALLDGGWARAEWRTVTAKVDTSATIELMAEDLPLSYRAAADSHVGLVRKNNQDAFLERSNAGIWVVADGLGGHREGDVASRMVCDALAEVQPQATFEETIYEVRQRLQGVNEYLLRTGTKAALSDRSASTVVVLLTRGLQSAILWAGDSRVYRFRGGALELLTRDHAPSEGGDTPPAPTNAITRAVGVDQELALDLLRDTTVPGDRFLLCSDGLTRNVPETHLSTWLAHEDLEAAVAGLIDATLEAGAPDNVTVVIVEARAAGA